MFLYFKNAFMGADPRRRESIKATDIFIRKMPPTEDSNGLNLLSDFCLAVTSGKDILLFAGDGERFRASSHDPRESF